MNVKIKNQNLCFKITEEELLKLCDGDCLNTTITFPGKELIVAVEPQEKLEKMLVELILDRDESYLSLSVSQEELKILSDMGRSREGIRQESEGVSISLQVDVRKYSKQGNGK